MEGVVLRQRRKIDELTGLLARRSACSRRRTADPEIDHRVKNSLQIVSAFLQMQRRQISMRRRGKAFADTSARVMSVRPGPRQPVPGRPGGTRSILGQTIESLCKDLAGLAGDGHSVDLTIERGMMVPYRKAVALSLIATELVTNAFKYAATPSGEGGSR